MLHQYDKIIKEQISLKIIEAVDDYKIGETHYLHHQPIIRSDKQKTKTIVFDYSCKCHPNGSSFNDILEPGPSVTSELSDVLLHFRCVNHSIVGNISADTYESNHRRCSVQKGVPLNSKDIIVFLT